MPRSKNPIAFPALPCQARFFGRKLHLRTNSVEGAAVRFGLRRFSAAFLFLFSVCFVLQQSSFPAAFIMPLFDQEPSKQTQNKRTKSLCTPKRNKQKTKKRRKSAAIQNQKQKSGGKAPQSKTDGWAGSKI